MTGFVIFIVVLKLTLFVIRSVRVFALKKIPVSYRVDLFGWQLLDLIAFLALVYFAYVSNTQGLLIFAAIYFYLIFKVGNECNKTILEGLEAKKIASASNEGPNS